jgi:hypothetical protein
LIAAREIHAEVEMDKSIRRDARVAVGLLQV